MSKQDMIEKITARADRAEMWTAETPVVWLEEAIEVVRQHTDWMPIASAPRDGTRIIGAGTHRGHPFVSTTFYNAYGLWVSFVDHATLTHWMPLPESPKQE